MKLARREFLKTAAVAGAASLIPAPVLWASLAREHRIVRVHNPLASCFDVLNFDYHPGIPESYYGNFVSQRIVDRMFDAALCAFTGEKEPVQAMRRLIPYKPGEHIFIKINVTTSYPLWGGDWNKINWDLHYHDTDAIAEPINALLRVLIRMGVPQDHIGLGDPTWSEGDPDSERRIVHLEDEHNARSGVFASKPNGKGVHDAVVEFNSGRFRAAEFAAVVGFLDEIARDN